MSTLQAILLGVLQGATEFLPVSSSGHLRLAERFLGFGEGMLGFDVALHIGTLAAVLVVFRRDIASLLAVFRRGWRAAEGAYLGRVALGCVPAFIVGGILVTWGDGFIETLGVRAVGVLLLLNGLWLMLGDRLGGAAAADAGEGLMPGRPISPRSAFLIGVAQAVAILPGISRSGSTISTGLLCGLGRAEAARFSFLLAIPAILAAGVKELPDALSSSIGPPQLLAGTVVSAAVGVVAIKWLLALLRTRRLWVFAVYCWVLGAVALIASFGAGVA